MKLCYFESIRVNKYHHIRVVIEVAVDMLKCARDVAQHTIKNDTVHGFKDARRQGYTMDLYAKDASSQVRYFFYYTTDPVGDENRYRDGLLW